MQIPVSMKSRTLRVANVLPASAQWSQRLIPLTTAPQHVVPAV